MAEFKIDGRSIAFMSSRQDAEAIKDALDEAAEWWHDNYKMLHFTVRAYRRYGYQRRKKDRIRTRKQFQTGAGAKEPLVDSGETKRQASRQRNFNSVATGWSRQAKRRKARVDIPLNLPTLNRKNPTSTINMRAEMEAVSKSEMAKITRIQADGYRLHLEKTGRRARGNVRIKK